MTACGIPYDQEVREVEVELLYPHRGSIEADLRKLMTEEELSNWISNEQDSTLETLF